MAKLLENLGFAVYLFNCFSNLVVLTQDTRKINKLYYVQLFFFPFLRPNNNKVSLLLLKEKVLSI